MSKPVESNLSNGAKRLLSAIFGLMRIQKSELVRMKDVSLARIAKLQPRQIPGVITELRAADLITIRQERRCVAFGLKPLSTT